MKALGTGISTRQVASLIHRSLCFCFTVLSLNSFIASNVGKSVEMFPVIKCAHLIRASAAVLDIELH